MSDKPIETTFDDAEEIAPPWEANVRTIASWSAEQWVAWLFQALFDRPRNTAPLSLATDSDLPSELARLHRRAPSAVGEAMKAGVVLAIRECPLTKERGPASLRTLALLAARIRAVRAVPTLVDLVSSHRATLQRCDAPRFDAIQECIAVLAGFAPDDRVFLLFEGLAFDNAVAPQVSAVLTPCLMRCEPVKFTRYLDRYVERRTLIKGPFSDAIVVLEIFRAIPPATIRNRFDQLSDDTQDYLVEHGGPLFDSRALFGLHALDKARADGAPVGSFDRLLRQYNKAVPKEGVVAQLLEELEPAAQRTRAPRRRAQAPVTGGH